MIVLLGEVVKSDYLPSVGTTYDPLPDTALHLSILMRTV
jgi:hypothetical protein